MERHDEFFRCVMRDLRALEQAESSQADYDRFMSEAIRGFLRMPVEEQERYISCYGTSRSDELARLNKLFLDYVLDQVQLMPPECQECLLRGALAVIEGEEVEFFCPRVRILQGPSLERVHVERPGPDAQACERFRNRPSFRLSDAGRKNQLAH